MKDFSSFFSSVITAMLLVVGQGASAASSFGPLTTPAALSAGLVDTKPIILDVRGETYSKGHISGAVSAPYGLFRGPEENPGQLLDVTVLEERFESLGLETDRPVVIVPEGRTDNDFGAAARVYWTLKSSGFTDLSILNGGMRAWVEQGFAIETAVVSPQPSQLDISFSKTWTAQTEDVLAVTKGEVDALLLDSRPNDYYQGRKSHAAAKKPGTLPGAQNFEYTSFFQNNSPAMLAIDNASGLRQRLGIDEGEPVVAFCNTGHWAATNWFAMSEVAGLDNIKLYPGSMVEYSNAGHELENTPGVFNHFLNKLQGN